jgi:ubiquinone/menaquinone biosynthesis C-methylase UbiE
MIQFAKEKAVKNGANVDFQIALIEAIPFPNASFDLVTSTLMIHHLPDSLQEKGFREIRRVLKPGGRFAVLDFASNSHSPIGHLLSIFGHGHGATAVDALEPRLSDAGFSDVAVVPTRHKNFLFLRAS